MNMFEDSKFLTEDVLTHKLPRELFKELTVFLKSANKKRKSKYGFLVSHDNHGKNSYQISVDSYLFEKSLMFGYLIKLGEYYYNNKSLGLYISSCTKVLTYFGTQSILTFIK